MQKEGKERMEKWSSVRVKEVEQKETKHLWNDCNEIKRKFRKKPLPNKSSIDF